jgi:hypothetical protein
MSTAAAFIDNSVPYGSFVVSLYRGQGGSAVLQGSYILESITVSRPTNKVLRPDQLGGPNGFALQNQQETASGVLQIASSAASFPRNGDWFQLTSDPTITNEKWVIDSISQPYEMNGYFKSNVTLIKAYTS